MLTRSAAALAAFLFLAVPVRAQQALSTLISTSRTLALDQQPNGRQRFSDSQYTTWLNDAQRQAVATTHCLRQSLNFTLLPGTTYYSLPANYLAMERATIGQKYIQQMSQNALDGRSRGWEAASGYPTYYFNPVSSPTLVGFAPWPAQSTDTDTVKMDFDVQAADLVNSGDLAFNGNPKMADYNQALPYYAAALASTVQGQAGRAQSYMSVYGAVVKTMSARCLEMPAYLPSAVGQP